MCKKYKNEVQLNSFDFAVEVREKFEQGNKQFCL